MTNRATIIGRAFEELALASYVFDLEPDELLSAGRRLDAMMATSPWTYLDTYAPGDMAAEIGTLPAYDDAIVYNLAVRLAPSYGKEASAETKRQAGIGVGRVSALAPVPAMTLTSRTPRGAGNRRWGRGAAYYPQVD